MITWFSVAAYSRLLIPQRYPRSLRGTTILSEKSGRIFPVSEEFSFRIFQGHGQKEGKIRKRRRFSAFLSYNLLNSYLSLYLSDTSRLIIGYRWSEIFQIFSFYPLFTCFSGVFCAFFMSRKLKKMAVIIARFDGIADNEMDIFRNAVPITVTT